WSAEVEGDSRLDAADLPARLLTTYLALEKLGLNTESIKDAMKATGGASLSAALTWLTIQKAKASQITAPSKNPPSPNPEDAQPTEGSLSVEVAVSKIDDKVKAQTLRLASAYSDESEPEDEAESNNNKLPLPARHATLNIEIDKVKELLANKQGDSGAIKTKLRVLLKQLRELEKYKGFDRNAAEVEYARLLKANKPSKLDEHQISKETPTPKDKFAEESSATGTPTSTTESFEQAGEDSDLDDGSLRLGELLELPAQPAPPPTSGSLASDVADASTHVPSRNLSVSASWTGKTPRALLLEQCVRSAAPTARRSVRVKISAIQDGRARFRARAEVCAPKGEKADDLETRNFELAQGDWLETPKAAEELVAGYRDFWLALDEEDRQRVENARREEEEARLGFLRTLALEQGGKPRSRVSAAAGGSASNGGDNVSTKTRPLATRNARLDKQMQSDLAVRRTSRRYMELLDSRKDLPVFAMRTEIVQTIMENLVVVVSGETGSGKSTQIPQFVLESEVDSGHGGTCSIVCTQPRRISAVSLAARVSEELGDGAFEGQRARWAGHIVRLDATATAATPLTYVTTGILLRRLQDEPLLSGVSCVVVDEVHERALEADFLLALLRRVAVARLTAWLHGRAASEDSMAPPPPPPLRVVLMSATADAEKFAAYFRSALVAAAPADAALPLAVDGMSLSRTCPVLRVPGRTFPVRALFLEDAIAATAFRVEPGSEFARRRGDEGRRAAGAVRVGRSGKAATVRYEVPAGAETGRAAAAAVSVRRRVDAADEDADGPSPLFDEGLMEDGGDEDAVEGGGGGADYSADTWAAVEQMDPHRVNLDLVEALVRHVAVTTLADLSGSVLVFLPGLAEIRRLFDRLAAPELRQNSLRDGGAPELWVLPLHSVLSGSEQAKGVTIPDVVCVIDSCRAREVSFDAKRNLSRLADVLVSQANCRQRRGRAGRVRPGVCYHLVTADSFERM
ncbi:ATP-dependent RNA helicase dhx29, partial [Cladochytrium tenue]